MEWTHQLHGVTCRKLAFVTQGKNKGIKKKWLSRCWCWPLKLSTKFYPVFSYCFEKPKVPEEVWLFQYAASVDGESPDSRWHSTSVPVPLQITARGIYVQYVQGPFIFFLWKERVFFCYILQPKCSWDPSWLIVWAELLSKRQRCGRNNNWQSFTSVLGLLEKQMPVGEYINTASQASKHILFGHLYHCQAC